MRIALAAIALVVAIGPASAQRIPDARDKEALRIYLEAMTADTDCPGVRVNMPQLRAYLKSQGFDEDTPQSRYPEFYDGSLGFVAKSMRTELKLQCQYFFDELGEAGVHPHILVRR